MNVEWSALAEQDWRRLALSDAVLVARAVQRFADAHEGLVIYIEGEYRLFVGGHMVSMLIDGDTLTSTACDARSLQPLIGDSGVSVRDTEPTSGLQSA